MSNYENELENIKENVIRPLYERLRHQLPPLNRDQAEQVQDLLANHLLNYIQTAQPFDANKVTGMLVHAMGEYAELANKHPEKFELLDALNLADKISLKDVSMVANGFKKMPDDQVDKLVLFLENSPRNEAERKEMLKEVWKHLIREMIRELDKEKKLSPKETEDLVEEFATKQVGPNPRSVKDLLNDLDVAVSQKTNQPTLSNPEKALENIITSLYSHMTESQAASVIPYVGSAIAESKVTEFDPKHMERTELVMSIVEECLQNSNADELREMGQLQRYNHSPKPTPFGEG